jgi:Uncharacterized alpha/beta hydrolase domain (DUF2235)
MNPTRRLVLLLDGTWNEDAAYDQDTNIVRLRDIISRGVTSEFYVPRSIEAVNKYDSGLVEFGACPYRGCDYFIFYERGVGTGPGLDRLSGGALGRGVDQNVRRAYKFLSQHYVPGSEIFIFGFSRGAYTARSVVGFLGSAGLLKAEHCAVDLEQQAWDYYSTPPNDRLPGIRRQLDEYVHSIDGLRVACLGVFDTVGALGVPLSSFWRANRERYEFHDVLLSPIVKLNLHALAIDERRLQFEASVWRQSKFRVSNSVTEQVWFPGEHSDVGGGFFSDLERNRGPRQLDDVTFDWLLKRLLHHYPDFPILDYAFAPLAGPGLTGEPLQHSSRTGKYMLSPAAVRAIGNTPAPLLSRERLVSQNRNESAVGESIHISALKRLGTIVPIAKPGDPNNKPKEKLYLPRNLIEHLPDWWERYCNNPARDWSLEALTVTTWTGNPVIPGITSDEELELVQGALTVAYERLEKLGYYLKSEKWNSAAAAPCLAAGKPAPKWLRKMTADPSHGQSTSRVSVVRVFGTGSGLK